MLAMHSPLSLASLTLLSRAAMQGHNVDHTWPQEADLVLQEVAWLHVKLTVSPLIGVYILNPTHVTR